MAISVDNVRRLRAYAEPNNAFCTDHTGTLGDYFDVPHVEDSFSMQLARPIETPMINQQHIDGFPELVIGPKSARMSFSSPLQALAARATGAATENALGKLFGIAMGGTYSGTGTTVNDAGATTTVIILTSATNFREGGAIGFATGTGGALECREIKTVSSNTVTLKQALTSAPANGSVAYACVTYYLDNLAGDTVTSLQCPVEGLEDDDRWLLLGGQIASPFTFDFDPGTIIPKVGWEWMFANWIQGEAAATDLTSSSISDQNLQSDGINAVFDSAFMAHALSNTTLSAPDVQTINIAPQIAYVPHTTPAGTNNIKQWVRARVAPAVTGNFTLPHTTDTRIDWRDAQTPLGFYYQIGSSTSTGAILISCPSVVVTDWQRENVGGIASQRMSFKTRLDTNTSTNSTSLQKSAFRIHMF